MKELLEIRFEGWTATPRLPFILSGNAVCMHTPSYSTILGVIGCCLGRIIEPHEVNVGYKYCYDSVGVDLETRHRLEFDGKKVKDHSKGTDAYKREFHVNPKLTIWLDKTDWEQNFNDPIGTPSLGQSQDLLIIKSVKKVQAEKIDKGVLSGCMIPYKSNVQSAGQLVQIAESFQENENVGSGRSPVNSRIFLSIPFDATKEITFDNLYTVSELTIYLHEWI